MALVFDLDQTLFDRRHAFEQWMASLGVSEVSRRRLRRADQDGFGDRKAFFQVFESITGRTIEQAGFGESLTRFINPNEELSQTLERLRNAFVIAILTNGGTRTQRAKIRALSLQSVFPPERIFISADCGFEKPDVRVFQCVNRSLGIAAANCVYFGDRMDTDISAAKAAGWDACLVSGPVELQRELSVRFEGVQC